MIAFVLSGAGNRGPVEVGALRALVEADLKPEFIVGTSAGAINSSYVAAHGLSLPVLEQVRQQWQGATADVVYPGNLVTIAWRLLSKQNSLFSSGGLRSLIKSGLPAGVETYSQLKLPLYVAAVDLVSSHLFVFGEDGSAPVVDSVLASASVPVIHPPVDYHGLQLVDGGTLANVAASFAMDKGATVIYVINAGYGGGPVAPARGVVEVAGHALNAMMARSLLRDLKHAQADPNIDLHHIQISAFSDISFRDFSKTDAMVQAGYDAAKAYLAAPRPQVVAPAAIAQPALGATIPGARQYLPPYMR